MLYFSDDDVLVNSRYYNEPIARFKHVHAWIAVADDIIHVPTILVTEIQNYPDVIPFIKEETLKGKMSPQLHGFEHCDYNKLNYTEIVDHLEKGRDWMVRNLNVLPSKFMTPWGANSEKIQEAAEVVGLKVVDCSNILTPQVVMGHLRRGVDPKHYDEKEVMFHWCDRGLRIPRIASCWKYGGFEASKREDPHLY